MICHNCGNDVPDGTKKCIYCGADLDKDIGKEKHIKRFIAVLIAVFIIGKGSGILISKKKKKKDNNGADTEESTELVVEDGGDKEQNEESVSESEQSEEMISEQSKEAVSEQSVEAILEEENDSSYFGLIGAFGITITDNVMIRNEASTDAGLIGSLSEGDEVAILNVVQSGDGYLWYYVWPLDNGDFGYVRSDLISIDSGQSALPGNGETATEKEDEQKTDNWPDDENSTALEEPAPFYGIWCSAYEDRDSAEIFASSMKEKGLPSEIFVTTDWSNLNKDKWYVISAGTYDTKESAENMLSKVQNHYSKAYIKYSGEWIGE